MFLSLVIGRVAFLLLDSTLSDGLNREPLFMLPVVYYCEITFGFSGRNRRAGPRERSRSNMGGSQVAG